MPANFDLVGAWAPTGADDTGYKGRIGLYEAIFMDEHLGNFLRDNPSEGDITKEVARQGYLTMAQDGVLKATQGLTTLEEVFSVVDLPRD
jgi:type IV pilus assembly protein PilB